MMGLPPVRGEDSSWAQTDGLSTAGQGQPSRGEEKRDRRLAALSRWARQHTRSGARGRGARAASAGTAAAARRRDPLRTTTPGTTVYTRR